MNEQERIYEMEQLLQSARAICGRRGELTAWERFDASIAKLGIGSITARTYRVLPSDLEEEPPRRTRNDQTHLEREPDAVRGSPAAGRGGE